MSAHPTRRSFLKAIAAIVAAPSLGGTAVAERVVKVTVRCPVIMGTANALSIRAASRNALGKWVAEQIEADVIEAAAGWGRIK